MEQDNKNIQNSCCNIKINDNNKNENSFVEVETKACDVREKCCHKTKERTSDEQKKLINRLSRIEGQIRGIKGMVEKSAYCTDILVQVSAVTSALNSFSRELLSNHIKSCVVEDIKANKEETVDDLISTLKKILK